MDSSLTNVSPRFLLRNIISTEPPRSPVTRSWPAAAQRDVETEGRLVRRSLRHRKTLPGTGTTPDKHLITVQKDPPVEVEDQGSTTRRSRRSGRSLPSTGHSPDIHLKELHKVSQVGVQTQGDIVRRVRSSKRLSGICQTPHEALKMHLKQKLHKSASGSALVLESRRRSGSRRPGPTTSLLEDDDVTPRRLLQNIMSTAAVVTPGIHVRTEAEGSDRPTDVSVASSTASIDLDLSDVTLAGIASTARVLRRPRQRQSFNVGAFEKNMDSSQVAELQAEESGHDLLSLSTSLGSASLSLNTPSVEASSRRAGLRRKTQRQTKFSAEDFIAAVHQRQLAGGHAESKDRPHLTDSFTHEVSDLPDITTDIIHQRTKLYDTLEPPGGAEQGAGDRSDQPPNEEHPSTKDRTSTEDLPSTEDPRPCEGPPSAEEGGGITYPPAVAEAVTMETGEEEEEKEGAETNVEEEEQGKTMAMETQSEEEVAMETQSEEEVAMETQSEEEVPGYQTASGQPGVEGSSSRPRSEGHILGDHRSEGHLPREHRSEGHLLGDHRSEGHLPREHRSEGHLLAEHRSAQRERGYKSIGVIDPSKMMEENDLARIGPTNVADHESIRSSAGQAEGVEGEEEEEEEEVQGVEGEEVEQAVVEVELGDKGVQGEEEVQGEEGEEEGDEEVMGEEDGEEEGVQAEELQEEEQALVVEVELGEEGVQEEEEGVQGEQGDDGVPAEEFQKEEKATEEVEQGDDEEEEEQGDEGVQAEEWQEEEEEVLEEEEVEEEEEEEEEGEQSEELSMKTPAFVRMKKVFDPPLGESSTAPQQGPPDTRKAPAKPRKVRAKQERASHLPKSYLMSTFKHFAKTRVAADVFPALDNIVDAYFQRMALDLETYANHAKRKTIEVADVELLLRRQGYVTDKVPVEVLIEKYLPMEYRRMLIPIATSGNIVIPKQK